MFRRLTIFLMTLSFFQYSNSLIVPQELPSVLSLIYSIIPQLKKGTDSRLGFGFRLGEHADFQVMVELGPQKETQPIGDDDSSSSSKRQVNQKDYNFLNRHENDIILTEKTTTESWIQNWSNEIKKSMIKAKEQNKKKETSISSPFYVKKSISRLPEGTLRQLQMLHYLATTTTGSPQPIVVAELTNDTNVDISASYGSTNPIPKFNVPDFVPIPALRMPSKVRKTKGEITEELMDVTLE